MYRYRYRIYMYVPGTLLCCLGIFLCCLEVLNRSRYTSLANLAYVSWRDFGFFPTNWLVFVFMTLSMFFVLGIIIWKMFCVISFMRELNKDYDLILKPYDTDGLGGFKPLEKLWFKMSFVAMPILANLIILSVLGYFWGPAYYPLGRSFDLLLTLFVIVVLLIYPIQKYHSIIETQKANFIEDIERKIDRHYKKIKEALSEEEKDLEKGYLGQIRQLQEIMGDVKSIPSWPFRTYQKIYIFLGALIPLIMESIIPWIMKIINYLA